MRSQKGLAVDPGARRILVQYIHRRESSLAGFQLAYLRDGLAISSPREEI